MAVDGIFFNNDSLTGSRTVSGKDASQLGMDDFLNLLVAQFQNQDMLDPVSDTDFIAQLAQFTALEGIQSIQEYQVSAYATSYVGKYVTIAYTTDFGTMDTVKGVVEAVNFYDGSPKVVVDGKSYDLYTVMEVSSAADGLSLNQAAQYIGKTVTVSWMSSDEKKTKTVTGVVSGVTASSSKIKEDSDGRVSSETGALILIDGKEYSVDKITKVVEAEDDDE